MSVNRALVLNAGTKGVAFAKDLMAHGVEVYLYDYRDGMFGLALPGVKRWKYNNLYPNPKKYPEAFAQYVYDLELAVHFDIIFAVNSDELKALHKTGVDERLWAHTQFPSSQDYLVFQNKLWQISEFRHAMPRSFVVDCDVYLKPPDQTSGRGVRRIHVPRGYPHVIQTAFDGVGVGYEALCDSGTPLYSFMHRRVREFPIRGGSSTARQGFWHRTIELVSLDIIKMLQWTGFIMLEFKWDESTDTFCLIEINPRPWGSIQLAIDSGVSFPWLAYEWFVHRRKHPVSKTLGIETRIVPLDLAAGLQHLCKGDFAQFWDSVSLWKNFRWEAFTLRDWRVSLAGVYCAFKKLALPLVQAARSVVRGGRV